MSDGKGDVWVEAGFTELARSGVEGVRVEVLAKNLGVTKGGFYRRFADRAALLDAMLERWREGRAAAIAQQTQPRRPRPARTAEGGDPALFRAAEPGGAWRSSLRSGNGPAPTRTRGGAVASVDAARLKHVAELYRATGLAAEEAEAQAFLFYCFIFGQSLAVRRARPAQAVAAGGEIGREAAGLEQDGRSAAPACCSHLEASGGALQLLVAFAVIAAALLDPLQAAIAVGGLVGVVLVDAGVQAPCRGSPWHISDRSRSDRSRVRPAGSARRPGPPPSWPASARREQRRSQVGAEQPARQQPALHPRRIGPCGSHSTSWCRACRPSWPPDTWRCIPARSAPAPAPSPPTQQHPTPQSRTAFSIEWSSLGLLLGLPRGKRNETLAILACSAICDKEAMASAAKSIVIRAVQIIHVAFSNASRRFATFAIPRKKSAAP